MTFRLTITACCVGLVSWAIGTQTAVAQFPAPPQPTVQSPPVIVPSQSNGLPIGVPETTEGIHGEPMQRYDSPYPWMHGYWQEIPPYSGYAAFRPYNYKHVLSQAQAAGGWGMSPKMPYAQQYWHKYRQRALVPMYSTRPAHPSRDLSRFSHQTHSGPVIIPASRSRNR